MKVSVTADAEMEMPQENFMQYQGARLLQPLDCEDDKVTKAIEQARALLRSYDADNEGQKVLFLKNEF